MPKALEIQKIGASLGVALPTKILTELGVGEGDCLYLVRTPYGVELIPNGPDFAQAIEASRNIMRRYPNAMKKLAEN
jgi:putative addiction module antidote